jgi:hypothetical protein
VQLTLQGHDLLEADPFRESNHDGVGFPSDDSPFHPNLVAVRELQVPLPCLPRFDRFKAAARESATCFSEIDHDKAGRSDNPTWLLGDGKPHTVECSVL